MVTTPWAHGVTLTIHSSRSRFAGRLDSGVRAAIEMTGEFTAGELAIALTGSVAGWLLAQITTSLRAFIDRYRAKRLIIEELKDIKLETVRLMTFYGRELHIHGANGVGPLHVLALPTLVTKNTTK